MHVFSIISTKGGADKTTVAANLGSLLADAGKRALLPDLDIQPLSSYFDHTYEAPRRRLCADRPQRDRPRADRLAQRHTQSRPDLLQRRAGSVDHPVVACRRWSPAPASPAGALQPALDLILIDTQGARSVLLAMAILASDRALSPIIPEMLAARELRRGTLKLRPDLAPFRRLGIEPPPLSIVLNRTDSVSADAQMIMYSRRQTFAEEPTISVLDTVIPSIVAYRQAATLGQPAHRVEARRPRGRRAPSALETMRAFASALFPQWVPAIAAVGGNLLALSRGGLEQ